jgi:uncharacterized surface protein with fasciclin (FAS1) repeats
MRSVGPTVRAQSFIVAVLFGLAGLSGPAAMPAGAQADDGYRFVCDDGGAGLHLVDVLRATGEHTTFLALMEEHDPEGFAILADVALADKTVWAPTDAAFAALDATLAGGLAAVPTDDAKRVLGNHISPPRRSPTGAYDIVTPEFLLAEGEVVHRTRTGVLSGTEQRIRSRFIDGDLRIEGARILPTAWCAEAGSVFAIDAVITDVAVPSLPAQVGYRLVRALLYDDVRFVIWPTVGGVVIGSVVSLLVRRSGRRR